MALAVAPVLPDNIVPISPVFRAGITYLNRGWSVIPIRAGQKTPLLAWEVYQRRLAAEDELMDWCDQWPAMNLAIVTGRISDLTVLDVDTTHDGLASLTRLREQGLVLPPTRIAATPHGFHYYLRHDARLPTVGGLLPGIDIRSEGGYVVAPPSRLA